MYKEKLEEEQNKKEENEEQNEEEEGEEEREEEVSKEESYESSGYPQIRRERSYVGSFQNGPDWLSWLFYRFFAWISVSLYCSLFYVVIILAISVIPIFFFSKIASLVLAGVLLILAVFPHRPWPIVRKIYSLWNDIFSLSVTYPLPKLNPNQIYIFYGIKKEKKNKEKQRRKKK